MIFCRVLQTEYVIPDLGQFGDFSAYRTLEQSSAPLTGSEWAWLKKYPDGRSAEAVSFRALS
jgi:hypothetical protein